MCHRWSRCQNIWSHHNQSDPTVFLSKLVCYMCYPISQHLTHGETEQRDIFPAIHFWPRNSVIVSESPPDINLKAVFVRRSIFVSESPMVSMPHATMWSLLLKKNQPVSTLATWIFRCERHQISSFSFSFMMHLPSTLLALSLCWIASVEAQITIYGQIPFGLTQSQSSGAAATPTAAAFAQTTLTPPPVPQPQPQVAFSLSLPRNAADVPGLSIPHTDGSFYGLSIEMSVTNQVCESFIFFALLTCSFVGSQWERIRKFIWWN